MKCEKCPLKNIDKPCWVESQDHKRYCELADIPGYRKFILEKSGEEVPEELLEKLNYDLVIPESAVTPRPKDTGISARVLRLALKDNEFLAAYGDDPLIEDARKKVSCNCGGVHAFNEVARKMVGKYGKEIRAWYKINQAKFG